MKVLFLVPHLSTGGMPQFLLKRIQALKSYTSTEVFVYEWEQITDQYVVQREQIINLLPKNNFVSCGYTDNIDEHKRNTITQYIEKNGIHIVHVEDIGENFINDDIQKKLYNSNKWAVVETPHSMNYNPDLINNKPNGYCYTIDYHSYINKTNVHRSVIKYPLDTSIVCNESRDNILEEIGWRTNGEYHIVNVGLWTPSKNQGYAIELAKKLWEKYGWTYIFHFVGNQAPNFKEYWEPLMDDLPPNIRIHGEHNNYNVSRFLKMSDLMLFTSTWESWGIVVEEAIANNLKIMAYNQDHWGDERLPFIEPLSGDIDNDYELFLNTIHSPKKYNDNDLKTKSNMVSFAKKHITLYKNLKLLPFRIRDTRK